jgi:hypothetical protein
MGGNDNFNAIVKFALTSVERMGDDTTVLQLR